MVVEMAPVVELTAALVAFERSLTLNKTTNTNVRYATPRYRNRVAAACQSFLRLYELLDNVCDHLHVNVETGKER